MDAKVKGMVLGLGVAAVFALCVYGDDFTDPRDNQTYRTVKIGFFTWMAENLNYAASSDSWCYDNNDSNCEIYGRLYTWNAAMSACPAGWHLPSDDEWQTLVDFVGGSSVAGTKLKSQTGWDTEGPWGDYISGTDDFGFSALPGGLGWSGVFNNVGLSGVWWSASENDADIARIRYMRYDDEDVYSDWGNKGNEFSVRCVRD